MKPPDLRVLESAGLEGRTTIALDAGAETPVLLAEVTATEMIEIWRRARAALHSTQHWPVLVTAPGGQDWISAFERDNPFSRSSWMQSETDDTNYSPGALIQRASELDLDQQVDTRLAGTISDERLDENIKWSCSDTRAHCGSAPSVEEVRSAVAHDQDPLALERYLLKWEVAQDCEVYVGHQDWYTPPSWPVALALLPDPRPWAAYAYAHTLWNTDQVMLIKAAERWYERYGAEPVSLWGTMTELLVQRPPTDLNEALLLALEHVVLAPSTLGPPGVRLRWHARALMVLDHWFLHSRP